MAAVGDVPVAGPQTPPNQFGLVNAEIRELFKRTPFRLTNYGGTSDAITADGTPFDINKVNEGTNALLDGQLILLTAQATNATPTPTLAVDAIPAKTIVNAAGVELGDGELIASADYILKYVAASDHLRIIARGSNGWFWRDEQATTSGTEKDFNDIPANVRQIIVAFNETSLSSNGALLVLLGDAGGFETTGYVSTGIRLTDASVSAGVSSTAGFILGTNVAPAAVVSGHMTLTRTDGNTWIASHSVKVSATAVGLGGGSKTLSDTLTRIRVTRSGSDTFDNGAVSLGYQLDA